MKSGPTPSDCEVLAGSVERVTYHNAENDYCVLRVKALDILRAATGTHDRCTTTEPTRPRPACQAGFTGREALSLTVWSGDIVHESKSEDAIRSIARESIKSACKLLKDNCIPIRVDDRTSFATT